MSNSWLLEPTLKLYMIYSCTLTEYLESFSNILCLCIQHCKWTAVARDSTELILLNLFANESQ